MAANLLSNYMGASKPKLITSYTSGTGTYVPTSDMARCFVRIQAGGGGGGNYGGTNYGGGGGSMVEAIIRIPIAGIAYTVGAGGTTSPATNGSRSSIGHIIALPGIGGHVGTGYYYSGFGGTIHVLSGSVDTDTTTVLVGSGYSGTSGGGGGTGAASGRLVGNPFPTNTSFMTAFANTLAIDEFGNGQGAGSGGDSFYGKGGLAGQAPASDAYGAGGGGHATTPGSGRGGYLEIWDYGV